MKLNEIYSEKFIAKLNQINDGSNLDPNLEVDGFIDIESILESLNFEVEFVSNMNGSGHIEGSKITIDESENRARQRFSMAHELGHAVQNDRHANRKDNPDDYSSEERRKEVFANTFAAQLLMPKILVREAIDKSINENNFNATKLSTENVDMIINDISRKLGVSSVAMRYRVENLNMFIPAGD